MRDTLVESLCKLTEDQRQVTLVSVGDFLREACSVLDYVKRTGNVVRLKKRDDPTVVIVPLQVWRDAQTLHEKEVRDALQLQRFLKSQLKDFEFEDLKSDAGIK